MAAKEEEDGEEELESTEPKASEGKDLDRMTDRVEEATTAAASGSSVQEALARHISAEAERAAAAHARERALAAVRLELEDVNLVATELELDKKEAERLLREHEGDAVATLRAALKV